MGLPRNYVLVDNYIYISHLDNVDAKYDKKNDHLGNSFKYWILPSCPDTITDSMSCTFQGTNALGRTAPVQTFSNAGPRTIQVEIKLHRDLMDDVNYKVSNSELELGEDYVENLIKALQAIALPAYNIYNKAIEPPMVALRFARQIFIKGVVSSGVTVTWGLPLLANDKYAQCSISFQVTEITPFTASEVFKSGGFRGVVNSMKSGFNLE